MINFYDVIFDQADRVRAALAKLMRQVAELAVPLLARSGSE